MSVSSFVHDVDRNTVDRLNKITKYCHDILIKEKLCESNGNNLEIKSPVSNNGHTSNITFNLNRAGVSTILNLPRVRLLYQLKVCYLLTSLLPLS